VLHVTVGTAQETERQQHRSIPKIFQCTFVIEMSLRVTMYRTPEGGVEAENTKYF
jgi:hypothetical protein